MKLIFVRGLWGMEELGIDAQCKRISEAGFDTIEGISPDDNNRNEWLETLDKYQLSFVAQHHSAGENADEHCASIEAQYERALKMKPLLVNVHSGKDFFSLEDNLKIIDHAQSLEDAQAIPIMHEIHRGRCTFSSSACMALLNARPALKLTADFSHWCCVHESLLADQQDRVDRAIDRSFHIHARVGHAEGPQITHPADPHWQSALDAHLSWWDQIVETRKQSAATQLTICPEFGPASYMPTLPFTNQPVADLFEVNKYMLDLLKQRYQ